MIPPHKQQTLVPQEVFVMTATFRNGALSFVYNPFVARIAMAVFAMAVLLLQPTAPISGGGGA